MHSNQGFSWRGAGLCAVTTHASTNASCKAKQMRHCYFMPVLIVFPFALAKAKKTPTVIKKNLAKTNTDETAPPIIITTTTRGSQ